MLYRDDIVFVSCHYVLAILPIWIDFESCAHVAFTPT